MIQGIEDILKKTLDALFTEYGPIFILLILVIIYLFRRYEKSHKDIVKQKDAEIERLVDERNWLQDQLIPNRKSSRRARKR